MPITVKQIILWRTEVDNKPGALASTMEPPATAGADLTVIMGYKHPTAERKAVVEVFPIIGKKLTAAAESAGLGAASIPTLLVEGDNKAGLGYAVAQAIGAAGINIAFFVAQAIGQRFAAVIGFDSEDDAKKAAPLIKKATKSTRA
jgi:energy-converting hydrogenase Eha subunit B